MWLAACILDIRPFEMGTALTFTTPPERRIESIVLLAVSSGCCPLHLRLSWNAMSFERGNSLVWRPVSTIPSIERPTSSNTTSMHLAIPRRQCVPQTLGPSMAEQDGCLGDSSSQGFHRGPTPPSRGHNPRRLSPKLSSAFSCGAKPSVRMLLVHQESPSLCPFRPAPSIATLFRSRRQGWMFLPTVARSNRGLCYLGAGKDTGLID